MFCTECGTELKATAKFCYKCGTAILSISTNGIEQEAEASPVPIRIVPLPSESEPIAPAPAPAAEEAVYIPPVPHPAYAAPAPELDSPIAYVEEEPKQWWQNPLVWVGFAGVLFAFLAWGTRDFWLGTRSSTTGNSIAAASSGPVVTPTNSTTGTIYYAIRKLKLRDKATTVGSNIKGEIQRGATVSGTIVMGEDEKSQWLKIDGSGLFASIANLSETAPVPLKSILNKTITLDEDTVIKNGAADSALPIDNAPKGTAVEAIGVTNDGWVEIALKQSGVGYFKPSAASANAALLQGKLPAVAQAVNFDGLFQFNANECNYGPQMQGVFAAMSSNANGAPFSVPGSSGQYKSTRNGAPDSPETLVTAPVTGKLKGLNVTGLYLSYEGQGMYFGDSVEAVGQALSSYGFVKQDDGTYATDAGGVGGYITKTNGKTTLYCGA